MIVNRHHKHRILSFGNAIYKTYYVDFYLEAGYFEIIPA